MQFVIDKTGIIPNTSDMEFIEAKIGLSLSRFNSLISQFDISFSSAESSGQNIVVCTIHISMANSPDFVISDSSKSLQDSFALALNRIKRNIERSIKRKGTSRISNNIQL